MNRKIQYALIVGNVADGIQLFGPFQTIDEATLYAESDTDIRDLGWVVTEIWYEESK